MKLFTAGGDNRYRIFLILLVFMAIAFAIRMIPALFVRDGGFLYTLDTDTWYTLRQIEVAVHTFPQYNWFDPMTAFPTGKVLDWGPLFPLMGATLCLITGATTQTAIVWVSSCLAPLMAAFMVPVIYLVGKTVWDQRTGLIAAALMSVVSLAFYSLTTFGLVIHHVGEVLFATLFFLVYQYYLVSVKWQVQDIREVKTLVAPVAFAALAGVLYFLALITSTTTLLVLAIITLFTLVQVVSDHLASQRSDRLLVLNLIFLSVTTILLLLFGIKQPGTSISTYSVGPVYVNLALMAGTIVLYGISAVLKGKNRLFLIFLAALAVAGGVLTLIVPPLQTIGQQAWVLLFGSPNFSAGVLNTAPLTLSLAWAYFNVALVLAAGGFLVLGYHCAKERRAEWIFLFVWSAWMILLTLQYQRFEYFSTVNIVLLSAICITEPFTWKKKDGSPITLHALVPLFSSHKSPAGNGKGHEADKNSRLQRANKTKKPAKSTGSAESRADDLKLFCLGAVAILAVVLFAVSLYLDLDLGFNNPVREISPDWVDTVTWLGTGTPPTGVDYYQQYEAAMFSYPATAYGILAEWSAGHWITFFSHRIPITNPFQDHLGGSTGGYAFYLNTNETQADNILQGLGGRYVITDSDLAVDNFASLVLWENNSPDVSPYITELMVQGGSGSQGLLPAYVYDPAYFRTMIVRLQNFDGSLQEPGTVNYIRYRVQQLPSGGYARVITGEKPLDLSQPDNSSPIISESGGVPAGGEYANVFAALPNSSLEAVPALDHFRLVHESPDDAMVRMFSGAAPVTLPGIKEVKVFEYVNGAHIAGNGIIEVPVRTNTGRTFVYRQASQNSEFVVPYSQSGNSYVVQATGPYHIDGTERYINVTEDDVVNGVTVG
jgi:dolichyl-diphosphooligosaccharide--protein glycosyltransferase